MPFVLMVGLLGAAGCTNNGAVPNKNETPMENLEDRTREVTPRVNDQTGPNMDGLPDGNRVNDGVIRDERNGTINENNPLAPNTDVPVNENTNPPVNNNEKNRQQPSENFRTNR